MEQQVLALTVLLTSSKCCSCIKTSLLRAAMLQDGAMRQAISDIVVANASRVAASFDSTFVLVVPNAQLSSPVGAVTLRKGLMA
jgi:hypothetical protein